jgi:hypothetical protein
MFNLYVFQIIFSYDNLFIKILLYIEVLGMDVSGYVGINVGDNGVLGTDVEAGEV